MFLGAQANTCEKFWACNGDDQCKADCQKNYKGTGWCDFHKAIPPEKYCFCQYNCWLVISHYFSTLLEAWNKWKLFLLENHFSLKLDMHSRYFNVILYEQSYVTNLELDSAGKIVLPSGVFANFLWRCNWWLNVNFIRMAENYENMSVQLSLAS